MALEYMDIDALPQTHDQWRRPLGLIVTGVTAFGVQNPHEVTLALLAQFVFYMFNFEASPEPLYSMLAGIQVGRGKFKYALPATLLDGYYGIHDLKGSISNKSMFVLVTWFVGFALSKNNWIK